MNEAQDAADLARAGQLLDADHAEEAERLAREVISRQPESAPAFELLAAALHQQGRHRESVATARAGLALAAEDFGLGLLLAQGLVQLNRGDEAEEVAVGLMQAHPHSHAAAHVLAHAYLAQGLGKARLALGAAQQALRLAPHSADALNLAGICHQRLYEFDLARGAFEAALRVDPFHSLALSNLAALDIQDGRVLSGGRKLTLALSSRPNSRLVQRVVAHQVTRISLYLFLLGLVGLLVTFLLTFHPWWVHAAAATLFLASAVTIAVPVLRSLPPGFRGWAPVIWRASSVMTRVTLVVGVLVYVAMIGLGFGPSTPRPEDASGDGSGIGLVGSLLPIGVICVYWWRVGQDRFGWGRKPRRPDREGTPYS
jgi:Flp pilus assembly protein TadD